MDSWFPYCGASGGGQETSLIQRTFVDPPRPDSFISLFIRLVSPYSVARTVVGSEHTAVKKANPGAPRGPLSLSSGRRDRKVCKRVCIVTKCGGCSEGCEGARRRRILAEGRDG